MLVSTRDVTRIQIGDPAELQIDGLDGMVMGAVNQINPVAIEGSRSVLVYVRLENPANRLWGGMFATGSILVREEKDILVVPATSMREDGNGPFVLKLEADQLVRQTVAVRARWDGGKTVQIEGVRAGDLIVASPLSDFRPGIAVVLAQAN